MLRKIFIHNCKRIEPLLWQYAGGQLKPDQKARVNAHLAHCAACQTRLQTIARIGQGLETLRQAPVPATQSSWADVQARLAAIPITPQPAAPMRKAVPYRALMGAGVAAAMALLWVALVPRHSEQESTTEKTTQIRPAKQNVAAFTMTTNSATDANAGEEHTAFEKSFLRKSSQDVAPYLTRSFAPTLRFAKVAAMDNKLIRGKSVAWHGGKWVRSHHSAQSRGLLLARREAIRPQRNAIAPGPSATGFTPITVTLSAQTPNYVLTGVAG